MTTKEELHAELGAASAELWSLARQLDDKRIQTRDLIDECAALRAEVERLRAENTKARRRADKAERENHDLRQSKRWFDRNEELRAEIDHLKAELDMQRRRADHHQGAAETLRADRAAQAAEYTKRLEAWEVDRKQLLADRAALVARAEAAERERDTNADAWTVQWNRANAAESECAALRADRDQVLRERECARAQLAELRAKVTDRTERHAECFRQLAAANALLGRIGVWADTYGAALVPHGGAADTYGDGVRACKAQIKAMLSGQPAAQPAAPSEIGPIRTAAEQRVLDAMGEAAVFSLIQLSKLEPGQKYASVGVACKAELARRRNAK